MALLSQNISILRKEYYLSDLLPYDLNNKKRADLRTSLKEYQMLLALSLEAVSALIRGDLNKFDALVGENACAIRAVWIALIHSKNLINPHVLKEDILNLNKLVNSFLEESTISRLMNSGISAMQFFSERKIFLELNIDELFIINCFILTETKITLSDENLINSFVIKEKSDPKKLKKYGEISSSFAENIFSKARKFVAMNSVDFVRTNAHRLHNENLKEMLSEKFVVNHNNHLLCTPMFWTYQSVLSIAHTEMIPLIIHAKFLRNELEKYKVVDEDYLFFEPILRKDGHMDYKQKTIEDVDHYKAAWVIQGVVHPQHNKPTSKRDWRKNISKYSINTVILSGAADHRQYPNEEKDELINSLQNHEYESYKFFAKSEGFSLNNPSIFFIQHVYPSKVGSVFSQL